jgi:DNA (cytosine-5)-methyltransferase 1
MTNNISRRPPRRLASKTVSGRRAPTACLGGDRAIAKRRGRGDDGIRFADIFCGIGGFRYAFEHAGATCAFSCDWDSHAQKTYAANFGEQPLGDIREIAFEQVPPIDVLCAGFPCQPFSIAGVSKKQSLGQKHGFLDKKQGNLFFSLADLIAKTRPRAFLLENVKHLQRHDGGRTFRVIHDTLVETLGYHIYTKVIDARVVVPQHRERLFIVGFANPTPFTFPDFPSDEPTLKDILDGDVPAKYTLTDHLWGYLQKYAQKHRAAGNGFGYGLVTGESIARTLSARYYKDGSEILIAQEAGRNPRRLTPRECARLMGFPSDMEIPVSDTQAYRQFGNSVVVPVVAAIAKQMIAALQGNKKPSRPQSGATRPRDRKVRAKADGGGRRARRASL